LIENSIIDTLVLNKSKNSYKIEKNLKNQNITLVMTLNNN